MKIKDLSFAPSPGNDHDNSLFTSYFGKHRITVVERLTGFGWFDTETGYTAPRGEFWLASGNFDIRMFPDMLIQDAIEHIQKNANTCVGI